jgi:hypothetical protein
MTLGALACGALGAAFDQLTVTLSPEYFTIGKGADLEGLRLSAALIGFKGGLPLGALIAGVLLWCRSRDARVRPLTFVARTAGATAIAGLVCALILLTFDPFQIRVESQGVLSATAADRYLACWGLHIGAYAGPLTLAGATLSRT